MKRSTWRTVLLVVEGDTEFNYVAAVRRFEATRHLSRAVNAKGGGGIVKSLSATRLDAFSEIWVVMDSEAHGHRECCAVGNWIAVQPDPLRFRVVVNAPTFEAWLLAHFEVPAGSGRQIAERLRELTGFVKPRLPPGFPRDDWPAAARRIPGLDLAVPEIPSEIRDCPYCTPASAMSQLLPLLLGR